MNIGDYMYKVGDKVRIIPNLQAGNVFGFGLSVVSDMLQYRDTVQEIERIWGNWEHPGTRYRFKGIDWSWLDCHFEPVVEETESYEYW